MNITKLSKFNKQLEIYQKYSKKLSNQDNHLILEKINKKINKIIVGGSNCSNNLTEFQKEFNHMVSDTTLVIDIMQKKIEELQEIIKTIIKNDNQNLIKNIDTASSVLPNIKKEL
jgi:uncharacterized membrane protein (DUF106 family)